MTMNTNINDVNEIRICDDCGCVIETDDYYTTYDGRIICEDCYDSDYFTCEDCGKIFHIDDLISVNRGGSYVCPDCADRYYYRCDDCGEYFSEHNVRTDDFGTVICDDCYDWRDYTTCYDCGRISRDNYWNDEVDDYLCGDCERSRNANGAFHEYSYKPEPEFHMCDDEKRDGMDDMAIPYFGVELEIDGGDDHRDVSEDIQALGLPVYCKHDGSLDDEGVECVTHPCTLAYHENVFDWGALVDTALRHDYLSHNTSTCGLHVHVNRRCMGDTRAERNRTAGNLVLLCLPLWDKLVTFSRRTESRLNEWAKRPEPFRVTPGGAYCQDWKLYDLEGQDDETLMEMALNTYQDGRYQAVNLTNSSTVEFRLFRGSLKRSTILASIALVNNMVAYAKTHTPTECLHATFADVVNVENHEVLNAYCRQRNLI